MIQEKVGKKVNKEEKEASYVVLPSSFSSHYTVSPSFLFILGANALQSF